MLPSTYVRLCTRLAMAASVQCAPGWAIRSTSRRQFSTIKFLGVTGHRSGRPRGWEGRWRPAVRWRTSLSGDVQQAVWESKDAECPDLSAADSRLLEQARAVLAWEMERGNQNAMGSQGSRFHQWMLEALRSMGLGAHCGLLLKYEALGPEQRARECLRLHGLLRGDGGGALEAEAGAQGPPARPAPARRDFKASFAATAATHADTATASVRVLEEEQGSVGWHRARTRRLTASTFARALGFFRGRLFD